MEADDVGEESGGDRRYRVWVPECDEVAILGEAIDDRQHYRLTADLGEALNEIHRDVCPHRVRHDERLEEARRMQMLCFVALTEHPRTKSRTNLLSPGVKEERRRVNVFWMPSCPIPWACSSTVG
jgi:hypothetical protein